MKRGAPLKRSKPLRTRARLARRTRLSPRRARPRRNAAKDPARRAWLVTQPCAALSVPGHVCAGRMTVSHLGPKGTRHDRDAVHMCWGSHMNDWHGARGIFAGWSIERRRAWAAEQVRRHQERYAAGAAQEDE